MEIGNRKERLRDYASFPVKPQAGLGGSPTSSPVLRISRTLKNQPRQYAGAEMIVEKNVSGFLINPSEDG